MVRYPHIEGIIKSIENLHQERSAEQAPFIIEAKSRGTAYYQKYNITDEMWVERKINDGVTGPPTLFPNGEEWIDEETEEEMSGLKKWPNTDNFVSRSKEEDGIDALAWYRSFHYEPIQKWGIYMLDKGIYHLAEIFEGQYEQSEVTPETRQECIHDAVNLLYYHELFHFYTDLTAANLEISESRSMYVDYFQKRYPNGWLESDGAPSDIPAKLEEALANEFARKKTITKRSQQYKDTLKEFMERQPNGYAQWDAVRHYQKWYPGLSQLGERLLNEGSPLPQYMHVRALEDAIHRSYEWQVPVYIVDTIPENIYRFASFKKFDIISISDNAKKLLNKLKNPILKKKFYAKVDKLRGQTVRYDRNLSPLQKPGWWKYNLGKSGDSHGNPRIILYESYGGWSVEWVGKHTDYDKWRANQGM